MTHKGNISQITITAQDIVDVVIGGSPCQDLSVAGKRAGLKHEANGDNETTRSGLFMEQIRIMKEMRELDKASGRSGIDIRCRWGVWENVPGALSSNQGEDFRIVLEEFCKIADPKASVSRPSNGKWSNSGCIMGDDYSVAWRIMDARYNGVPQRRRRISLVADFAGQSAPKILFDEESMHWDFEASQEAWKRASGHAEHCSVGSSGEGLGVGTVGQVYLKFGPETSMLWNNIRRLEMRLADSEAEEGREKECDNLRYQLSEMYDELNEKIQHLIKGCTCTAEAFGETGVGYWQEGIQTLRAEGENRPSRPGNCIVEPIQINEQIATRSNALGEHTGLGIRQQEDHAFTLQAAHPHMVCHEANTPYKNNYTVGIIDRCGGFVGRQGAGSGSVAYEEHVAPTLRGNITADIVYAIEGNTIDRNSNKNGKGYGENESPTPNTQDRHAVVYDARGNGDGATCCTITGDHCNRVTDYTPLVTAIDCRNACGNEELSATLQAKPNGGFSYNCINPVCYEVHCFGEYREGVGTLRASGGDCGNGSEALVVSGFFDKQRIGQYGIGETSSTLSARDYKDASDLICTKTDNKYIVRRLTPLECSRLQGLQDDWCVVPPQETVSDEDLAFWKPFWDEWMQINGKKPKTENQITKWLMSEVSESAQYQMYGNGIAAPQWFWVCGRVIETYGEKKPTMASLFDGTGSFPWIWNSILEGEYTVWSSEVNPEAIRVSKYRIG